MTDKHEILVHVDGYELERALEELSLLEPSLLEHVSDLIVDGLPIAHLDVDDSATAGTSDVLVRLSAAEPLLKLMATLRAS